MGTNDGDDGFPKRKSHSVLRFRDLVKAMTQATTTAATKAAVSMEELITNQFPNSSAAS